MKNRFGPIVWDSRYAKVSDKLIVYHDNTLSMSMNDQTHSYTLIFVHMYTQILKNHVCGLEIFQSIKYFCKVH